MMDYNDSSLHAIYNLTQLTYAIIVKLWDYNKHIIS